MTQSRVLKLSSNDIIAILSERFEVPKLDIILKLDYGAGDGIEAFVTVRDEKKNSYNILKEE